jgi:hypothetical protein
MQVFAESIYSNVRSKELPVRMEAGRPAHGMF